MLNAKTARSAEIVATAVAVVDSVSAAPEAVVVAEQVNVDLAAEQVPRVVMALVEALPAVMVLVARRVETVVMAQALVARVASEIATAAAMAREITARSVSGCRCRRTFR
jgi:hypothetical protein